jgi:hypothetical protein
MTASEVDEPGPVAADRTAARPGIAGAAQAALRARTPRPAVQGLLALLAYLAVFIVLFASPLLLHPGTPQVGQGSVDPNFYVWSLRWWPYAIAHGLNPLHSQQIGVPSGFDLSWTTTAPALALVMAPVTAAFGPITAFNLTLLLAPPVSAWATFLAARRLTGRFWGALAAGGIYGFCPFEIGHTGAGQANLVVVMLLPLIVYLVLLWRDKKLGDVLFTCLLAIALAAEFYVFNEAFAELTGLGAAALVLGFLLARAEQRRVIARLAGLAVIAGVAAAVLASPYLIYAVRHYQAGFTKAIPANSLNLDYITAFPSAIPLLLIVLVLAVVTWSSRLTRVLVIVLALVLALALGPDLEAGSHQVGPLPWGRLWSLPVARSAEPTRLLLFGYLVLAIMVALWLAMPARNLLLVAFRWLVAVAAVVTLLAWEPPPASMGSVPASVVSAAVPRADPLPAFISSGRYRDFLRPGETVVVVSDRGNAGMMFQADTDFYFRIAGGFINAALTPADLPAPVEALMHPTPAAEQQFRSYVRQAGIGAILVEQAWSAPWMRVFSRMGLHGTPVGGMIVYPAG